jgi:hypothetical protein
LMKLLNIIARRIFLAERTVASKSCISDPKVRSPSCSNRCARIRKP